MDRFGRLPAARGQVRVVFRVVVGPVRFPVHSGPTDGARYERSEFRFDQVPTVFVVQFQRGQRAVRVRRPAHRVRRVEHLVQVAGEHETRVFLHEIQQQLIQRRVSDAFVRL